MRNRAHPPAHPPAQPSRTAPPPAKPDPVEVALGERCDFAAATYAGLVANAAAIALAERHAVAALREEHEKRHPPNDAAAPRFDARQIPVALLQRLAGRDLYSRAFAMARGALEARNGLAQRFREESRAKKPPETPEKSA